MGYIYPTSAPVLLGLAAASILGGTLRPDALGPLAFVWLAPSFFFMLNLRMLFAAGSLTLPSGLLLTGNVLTFSRTVGSAVAPGVASLIPSALPPLLAFLGPALLVARRGPDPVLLSWLASAGIGMQSALPPEWRVDLDGWRPGVASSMLMFIGSLLMLRTRWVTQPHAPPQERETSSPLGAYALVWASHTLLQTHSQQFLFPDGMALPIKLISCLLALRPSEATLTAAIVVRNLARVASMPFVWDSEYWLLLTDASMMACLCWRSERERNPLRGIGHLVRYQLGWCYAAAACFKFNSAFVNPRTSCAPIFGLSLLERAPPIAAWAEAAEPWVVRSLASAMPALVLLVEALIALLLLFERQRPARGVLLALAFHLAIAITPPPNGVPTFSCVAASRLVLCVDEDGLRAAWAARKLRATAQAHARSLATASAAAVAVLAAYRTTLDAPVGLFCALAGFNLLALTHAPPDDSPNAAAQPRAPPRRRCRWLLWGSALVYAFALPVLGLQEIGSCTMFANMRLVQGGSNHLLGLPTGLLQRWYAHTPSSTYGGGVVRIEYTTSEHLNALYPGEITTLIAPRTRRLLKLAGHVSRQFNPKARRVLGARIRAHMPRWTPHAPTPFVRFTIPAFELRRLIAEARRAASETNTTFDLTYTRLGAPPVGADIESWRRDAHGVRVELTHDDGRGNTRCASRDERPASERIGSGVDVSATASLWQAISGGWAACAPDELVMLPELPVLPRKLSLFYPYPVIPGVDDLICNY